MVPSMSYFPLVLPRVLQYFVAVVDHFDADSVWLRYNTKPLKWFVNFLSVLNYLRGCNLLVSRRKQLYFLLYFSLQFE